MAPEENNPDSQFQSFDEKPIGHGEKMPELSEYPPGFNPEELNGESRPEPLPLPKRIASKVWKIRKEAFEQLYQDVSETPNAYLDYLKDTIKFITDANIVCQEKALKVFLKFIESPGQVLEDPKPIIKALIEKCLIIEKGEIPNISTEIMFWMMDNYQLVLINELNEGLLNKNPKICGCVFAFLEKLINNYGVKKLNQLEEFSKSFTILSGTVKPVAKQQAVNMFKEAFRWMNSNVFNLNMQVEVKDEVNKFSKTYVHEQMQIKRGLNEDQKKGKKPLTENLDDDQNDEEQDVLAPYDSRWADKVLEETKWKDKKSLLDEFIKKTKVQNILPRDHTHFINLIKRLLADNNINLLQCGFKIIKNLSKGLKKNFAHPCKVILGYVFSKLRDTKAMIVDEAQETLEFMLYCLTIEEFQEDIKDGLKDKAPNMRFQTLKLIEKMLSKKDKKMIGCLKNLTLLIIDLSQDGSSEVRDKALSLLCKLKGVYGMNFFGDKLKKIQSKKLQTIENYFDPNENNAVEEQMAEKNDFEPIYDKKSVKTQSPLNRQQKIETKHSLISEPNPKISSFTSDFDSPSENARLFAYQSLQQKSHQTIYQELVEGFKNKIPMARESSPAILKIILNLIKKSIPLNSANPINADQINVLLYHDWKKCKTLITDFIQNNKLNLQALENVKNSGILIQSHGVQHKKMQSEGSSNHQAPLNQSNLHQNPLKIFYSSIQGLIPKMSSPDPVVRLQAAETALEILKEVPIGAPNDATAEPSASISEAISQLFNILKYRVQDSNEEIANNYINLVTEMLSKGFLTKYKTPGRMLISILIQKIPNHHLTNLEKFIHEMVCNHSTILWQFLTVELLKEQMCGVILNIIKANNDSFFDVADKKSYILPLLTNISKDIETQKCSELLDQIVEINGEATLEKVVKESKISGFAIENYLKKWKINIPSQPLSIIEKSKPQTTIGSPQILHSKIERLSIEQEDPWPINLSTPHIFKLIMQMMKMGEPFESLASPTLMLDHELAIVSNLRPDVIEDYSDIWAKWIFWRVHIESQPKNVEQLFHLILKLINSNFGLHESEIIILLASIISCLTLHKMTFMKSLIRIASILNQHPLYKQKSFRFWINSFNDPSAPVDEILHLIVHSCSDQIHTEMVTLARYPAVVRNKDFNEYLRANYSEKLLTVYGFKLQDLKNGEQKPIICESLALNLVTELESKYFIELFERCSSNELIEKLISETSGIPDENLMQTHLKIMHSVIVPYLKRELSFINVYNYFKFVQKIITAANSNGYLLNLVMTLSFFLIDLDEMKLENHGEMVRTINKLLLLLLEFSESKHILEVLFIIIKQQLKSNGNLKLILLLPKCIGKVIKNTTFKSQYKRTVDNTECLTYISKEVLEIVNCFDLSPDSSFLRAIKNLMSDMVSLFPHTITLLENLINENRETLSEKSIHLVKEITQDKLKENNNVNFIKTELPVIKSCSENNYSQNKEPNNMDKSLKTEGHLVLSSGKKYPNQE